MSEQDAQTLAPPQDIKAEDTDGHAGVDGDDDDGVAKSSSKFVGVNWHTRTQRWRATIKHQGKKIFLGTYQNEDEAARAFDRAAIKYRGASARTNFPVANYGDISVLIQEGLRELENPTPPRPKGRPPKNPDARGPNASALNKPNPVITPAMHSAGLDAVQAAIARVMSMPVTEFVEPLPGETKEEAAKKQQKALEWVKAQQTQRILAEQQAEAEAAARLAAQSATLMLPPQALMPPPPGPVPLPLAPGPPPQAIAGPVLPRKRGRPPKNPLLRPPGAPVAMQALQPAPLYGSQGVQQLLGQSPVVQYPPVPAMQESTPPAKKIKATVAPQQVPSPAGGTASQPSPQPGESPVAKKRSNHRYRGVSWVPEKNKWRAQIGLGNNRKMHIGYFADEDSAAHAFDRAALEYLGTTTSLNFPASEYVNVVPGSKQHLLGDPSVASASPAKAPVQPVYSPTPSAVAAATTVVASAPAPSPAPAPALAPAPEAPKIKSKYLGVVWLEKEKKWKAQIADRNHGKKVGRPKQIVIGVFSTEQEAAQAYDRYALQYVGADASTNFKYQQAPAVAPKPTMPVQAASPDIAEDDSQGTADAPTTAAAGTTEYSSRYAPQPVYLVATQQQQSAAPPGYSFYSSQAAQPTYTSGQHYPETATATTGSRKSAVAVNAAGYAPSSRAVPASSSQSQYSSVAYIVGAPPQTAAVGAAATSGSAYPQNANAVYAYPVAAQQSPSSGVGQQAYAAAPSQQQQYNYQQWSQGSYWAR